MAKLVTKSGLKVVADIAEGFSGKVKQGNEVLLQFPDLNKEIKARIGYVSQTINALNRTYRVDIPVSGPDLIPNMITKIRVIDYKMINLLSYLSIVFKRVKVVIMCLFQKMEKQKE
jgi:membrane fusion protein (multidrug efflux system)